MMMSAFLKVGGQGILALCSFVVSFAAAHSLNTRMLAIFFVAWTLESMWIAAIRKVLMPALIVVDSRPDAKFVWLLHAVASMPICGIIFMVAHVGGVDLQLAILLSLTPLALGSYEVARIFFGIRARSYVWIFDAILFIALCVISYLFIELLSFNLLDSALLSFSATSFLASTILCFTPLSIECVETKMGIMSWSRAVKNQMVTGFVEWVVFFAISMTGVFLLGFFGGPEVLSGVRLAETLVAPLSIAVAAVPLMLAPEVQHLRSLCGRWTNLCKRLCLVLVIVSSSWVALILLIPDEWLAVLVGEHVAVAKSALLGIGLGVVVSPFSTLLTFVLRINGSLKEIRSVRLLQLFVSIPLVAGAASTSNVTIAGMGLSAHQVLAGLYLFKVGRTQRRERSARASALMRVDNL